MAFHTIRSERQFCKQLRYNILFKWFLELNVEDEPFHPTTFTKNRERLMEADAARVSLKGVVRQVRGRIPRRGSSEWAAALLSRSRADRETGTAWSSMSS